MPKGEYGRGRAVRDHLGNEFASVRDMCRHYGISESTFGNRRNRGWTVEQALTVKTEGNTRKVKPKGRTWKDHLGNEYESIPAMCAAYGITDKIYQSRRRVCKWPLEKILTTPVTKLGGANGKKATDHLGNEFPSVSDMCRYHGVKLSRYKERVKLGWSVEKALTAPAREMNSMKAEACEDHLGNRYPSKNAMCRAYNIRRHTLMSRLELGWDLERALTEPLTTCGKPAVDYRNRKFPSLKDMANFYGIKPYNLGNLSPDGVMGAIEKYVPRRFAGFIMKDGSRISRCVSWPYFVSEKDGHESLVHVEKILADYHGRPELFGPLPETVIRPFIEIVKPLGFPYYLIGMDGKEFAATYWEIIRINAEANSGISAKRRKG